jgi:ribosomal protein S18 acetylase RimI-like enzyme
MTQPKGMQIPQRVDAPREVDYSTPESDFGPLARDRVPIRSMTERDLRSLTAIDQQITGRNRARYFEAKLAEALNESDVRVSLVAELDGVAVGFIMARVDFGEFGRLEATAALDTIGVDPNYAGRGVGRALLSQLLANLASLRVDQILTEVEWVDVNLLGFLAHCGFASSSRLSFVKELGEIASSSA